MLNHKMMPFERNRYFYGKLLTVRDFEVEQKYGNDKRRLMNRIGIGAGIISGLGVIKIDDKTILVEPGVAIDFGGREIVVDTPFTTRLSTVDGFDLLKDEGEAYLNILYDEEAKESVHNVSSGNDSSASSDYNRIREGFKLVLSPHAPALPNALDRLLDHAVYTLTDNEEVKVILKLDYCASPQHGYDVAVSIYPKRQTGNMRLKMVLSAQSLHNGKDMVIEFDQSKEGEQVFYSIEKNFEVPALMAQTVQVGLNYFEFKIGDSQIQMPLDPVNHNVKIDVGEKPALLRKRYEGLTLDAMLASTSDDVICLGIIRLIKTQETFVVDGVYTDPFDMRLPSLSLLKLLLAEQKATPPAARAALVPEQSAVLDQTMGVSRREEITSGTYTFRFNEKVSAKQKFISEEINHQLGTGEVFIEIAIDSDNGSGDMAFGHQNQMIQGDYDIFEKTSYETIMPPIKIGTIGYKNKGKFIVGIQFLESYARGELVVRWKATKVLKHYESLSKHSNGLVIEPAMAKVGLREKINFTVMLEDEAIPCKWTIKGEQGGEIDDQGVYISPSVEGVYEIIAEVKSLNESLSAYVIVES